MKIVHYKRSNGDPRALETMTVSEIIDKLLTLPPDLPALFTWETVFVPVTEPCFLVEKLRDGEDCLLLDAE
jgi:hypothetical protein